MRTPVKLIAICALLVACLSPAQSAEFVPGPYESNDGALFVLAGGNFVEPYFATKALLVAQDAGLDLRPASLRWIAWALPRQRPDGRFERYCRAHAGEWEACGQADADDSMLALWLQLLYRLAPNTGLPAEWQESAARAQRHLASLRNRRLGVYHISHRNHAALLMDNIEVYAALRDVSRAQARFGLHNQAAQTATNAQDLARAIERIFWDAHTGDFHVSTQKARRDSFYPHAVAQVFPLLADFSAPGQEPAAIWKTWRDRYSSEWLNRTGDPHPWGLLALTALKVGDRGSALCWLSQSEPFRYSKEWNVLEEAVYQGLEFDLAQERQEHLTACSEAMARR